MPAASAEGAYPRSQLRAPAPRLLRACALLFPLLGSACVASSDGKLPWGTSPAEARDAQSNTDDEIIQVDEDGGTSTARPDARAADTSPDGAVSDPAVGADLPPATQQFEALSPGVYTAKVKGLLTGLAASADEIARVTADPAALKLLIADWQKTPAYESRMLDFFTMAFQQGDVTAAMIANITPYEQGFLDDRVIQNMRESFGRTALQLIKEGAPFTDVLTTRRFMLTPALMVAMTWLEERQSGDGGGFSDALNNKLGPSAHYTMQADEMIPLEQSVDPASPNYLRFYAPQVAATTGDCRKPQLVDQNDRITLYTQTTGETMMMFFMGSRIQRGFCVYQGRGILDPSDFSSWRMMTIRAPRAGEERTWVYEIPKFRGGTELVYPKPHVGFYTTTAFLYTWQTNSSNQARVTANQTLIAAVGRKFDGSWNAKPASEQALDKGHAQPGSDCYNCHVSMDPMRQYFRNSLSLFWGLQEDRAQQAMPGVYAFDGQTKLGTGIADLGQTLAASERFAIGWVHKLCTWANSAVCDPAGDNTREPSDPEFLRVVQGFRQSKYDFNALVRELFSSPLVTYASDTATSKALGIAIPVAKRAQLCRQWDLRLGLDDVCGLRALPSTDSGDAIKTIATVLPADSYSRGQTVPTLANDPGLFFFAGVENACAQLAARVVDAGNNKFKSSEAPKAIADMVHGFMGLATPRDQQPIAILTEHFEAARATGVSPSDALRSSFVLACMAPSNVSVGL
jgi:hypothetical protein